MSADLVEEEFSVEKVMNKRVGRNGKTEYLLSLYRLYTTVGGGFGRLTAGQTCGMWILAAGEGESRGRGERDLCYLGGHPGPGDGWSQGEHGGHRHQDIPELAGLMVGQLCGLLCGDGEGLGDIRRGRVKQLVRVVEKIEGGVCDCGAWYEDI